MFAWTIHRYGNFREVLDWKEVETPEPGPGQALIRVSAAGVSFADILKIAGKHQARDPLPFMPGTDVVGEVVAVGRDSQLREGERIMSTNPFGAYGEYTRVEEKISYRVPNEISDVEAAAFSNAYQSSYIGLVHHGQLNKGEFLLVHGAAGALGLAAVQIGKLLGATVIATASTEEKLQACRRHGADHAINYRQDSFVDAVIEFTGGHGADVIYDPVGGDVFDMSRRCIAFRGRLVVAGFTSGRIPEIKANRLLLRTFTLTGFSLDGYLKHQPHLLDEAQEELFRMYTRAGLKPVISQVMPFAALKRAMELVESRQSIGKVVVLPD